MKHRTRLCTSSHPARQTLVDESLIEELASKFVFRFIGASTTRRLAESFVSIKTGKGSPHVVAHKRRDYSEGNLTVGFRDV